MNWNTENRSIRTDNTGLNSTINRFRTVVNTITGKGSVATGLNGLPVVGINVNEIPNMRNAIRDYVAHLDEHLNEVRTNADTSQAFKGEYASAITDYVSAICEACKCITSNLLMFSDKLVVIQEAYQAKDTSMKSAINSSSTEVESGFTRYTETR